MTKIMTTTNGPVDEGSDNAATATPEAKSTTSGPATPQEAATATDASDTATAHSTDSEVLADSSAEASEETGIDWKASSRKWERQSKENLRRVEELMESINSKDATVEELRAQVKAFEHAAQVDEWKAQVAADLGVKAEALRGDSLEEITAHAKVLKELYPDAPTPQPAARESGAGYYPARSSALSLDEQIAAAEKAGDHKLAASLKVSKLAALSR